MEWNESGKDLRFMGMTYAQRIPTQLLRLRVPQFPARAVVQDCLGSPLTRQMSY